MIKSKSVLLGSMLSVSLFFMQASFALDQETPNSEELIQNESIQDPATTALNISLNLTNKVITNKDNPTIKLGLNDLRAIFSLRARQWPDGKSIRVFVLDDNHPVHKDFVLKTLKMLPHQLRRHWDRYIYTGIGQGPSVLKTESEMIEQVAKTPGAIGYLNGGVSDASVHLLTIE